MISCRDDESTLGGQLDSLARQRPPFLWEVIVVDNGSVDRTVEVAESYRGLIPELQVLRAPSPLGAPFARNVGLRHARGSRILFLDADDAVADGYVEAMARALDRYPAVAARIDTSRLNPGWTAESRPGGQRTGLRHWQGFLPFAFGCSLGVRREALELIGGLNERSASGYDVDLCFDLQLAGYELGFVPEAVVHYRHRDSLRGLWSQARDYGGRGVQRFLDYRAVGMPRPSVARGLAAWVRFPFRLLLVRNRADLARLVFDLGFRVGRLQGSVRQRTLVL